MAPPSDTADTSSSVITISSTDTTTTDWGWCTTDRPYSNYFGGYYYQHKRWDLSYEELKYRYRFPHLRDGVPTCMRRRIAMELERQGWRRVNFRTPRPPEVYKARHFHRTDPRWSNRAWKCKARGQPIPRTYHRKKSLLKV